jgi:hypothetical protein
LLQRVGPISVQPHTPVLVFLARYAQLMTCQLCLGDKMESYDLILGGLGGIVGLFAGLIVSAILPKNGDGGTGLIGFVVVIGLIAGGAVFAPPHIEPHAARYVRQMVSGDINNRLPEMQTFDALYQAVRERDPQFANHWDRIVREAYVDGGLDAADRVARGEAFRMRGWLLSEYGARTSDEALLEYLRTFAEAIRSEVMADPYSCYAAFYPARTTPHARPLSDFEIASEDMAAAYAGIIEGAGLDPVEYDAYGAHMRGLSVLDAVAERQGMLFDELRDGRPTTETDFVTRCAAYSDYYDTLLAREDGASLFRYSIS